MESLEEAMYRIRNYCSVYDCADCPQQTQNGDDAGCKLLPDSNDELSLCPAPV